MFIRTITMGVRFCVHPYYVREDCCGSFCENSVWDVLLDEEAQVEARFGLLGDSANLDAR